MRKISKFIVLVTFLVTACGQAATTTTAPSTNTTDDVTVTAAPVTTEETAPEGLVETIQELPSATIQIVSIGTFVTPDFGSFESGGAGSGFIIDPSGVAVTNSHVVSGAGLIEVHIGGSDDPINARILGVSECNDLAVIDLEGDGYNYLEWYDGDIFSGLPVQAAGYPLGAPEFALTQGIISKGETPGDTDWASVEAILEHDARIRGGNSGGPLVTEEMQVVGVNYAGRDDTDQNYAISVSEARPIVEQLRGGVDVDSVGINGYAIFAEDGTSGVWVETVQAGSAADLVGITGGDIVTRMAGVSVGFDGTLADFCDVIRTQGGDAPIDVEVLRYNTSQVLRGQLNGEALAEAFSFAEELEEEATVEEDVGTQGYAEYVVISDDTGAMSVEVPAEWSDVLGSPYEDEEGRMITEIAAASDLTSFFETWTTPGMIFSASSDWAATTTEEELLDLSKVDWEQQCEYIGREPYEDPLYAGFYDTYVNCGDTAATYVVVATRPLEGNFIILVDIQANTDRDFEALDRILASFYVSGDV
ncbi:MAG: serine protease [Acidimicrobiia bacterium]|nr:serine protease [Acidimicrobiia bacterium]